jgi:hypothetical protein
MDHDRRAVPNPTLNQRHDPHAAAAEFEATQVLTLIDIALTFAGLMLVVYLVYLLFYSKKEALRREASAQSSGRRIDRREQERQDRRHRDAPPPDGEERRVGPRRTRDID